MIKIKRIILIIGTISIIIGAIFFLFLQKDEKVKIEYINPVFSSKEKSLYEKSTEKDIYHVALGDSIIKGWGSFDNKTSYIYYLDKKMNIDTKKTFKTKNEGVNGLTSSGLLKKIKKEKIKNEIKKADIITINIGGNDLLDNKNKLISKNFNKEYDKLSNKYEKNLKTIFEEIRKENKDALIVINDLYNSLGVKGITNVYLEIKLNEWNKKIEDIAQKDKKTILINLSKKTKYEEDIWYIDRVHFNDEGYEKLSNIWIEEMKNHYK